jgi:hypothetical protein
MKKTAELFINSLGPQDLAGLVYTGTTAKFSQNLTADRAKLLKALPSVPGQRQHALWYGNPEGDQALVWRTRKLFVSSMPSSISWRAF